MKKKDYLVSIILPVYNGEKYLLDCLVSLKKQSYKKIEIIVINDGSRDNSLKIAEKFKQENPLLSIVIINQKNLGVSIARNRGIEASSGDFISFIDSDDMYHEDFIKYLLHEVKNHEDSCVISVDDLKKIKNSNKISREKCLKLFLKRRLKPGVWSIMVSSKIIKQYKISFIEGLKYSEDVIFLYQVFAHSDSIHLTTKAKHIYRVHDESVMSRFNDDRLTAIEHLEKLEDFFKERNSKFYNFYKKYGVARWMFATLWQMALYSENFKNFKEEYKKYNAKKYIKKLVLYSDLKVSVLSFIFTISPRLYFKIIKKSKSKITTRNIV